MHQPTDRSILVDMQNIEKTKGANRVISGVNLTLERGKVTCLLGPSGAGKSTLLRCINAIEQPDSGVIYVDGEPIGFERRNGVLIRLRESQLARQRLNIGMVFQGFNLFPHLSVLENIVSAPMRVKGVSRPKAVEMARHLLQQVGLLDKIDCYPRQLSGGQQQRIAIARALAMEPKLMLFDEPTSALDPHTTDEVLDVLKNLAASGMTMVIVTHEMAFAREVSDHVVIMAEGRVVETGDSRTIFSQPQKPVTRAFLSKSILAA